MISYQANYEVGNKPYICKVFTASNGEELHTALHFGNEEERKGFSPELIYEHLNNLLQYIRDESLNTSMIALDEPISNNPFSIKNWEKIDWAQREIYFWWNDVYYRPESPINNPSIPEEFDDHHHENEDDPHWHNPVTGETMYFDPETGDILSAPLGSTGATGPSPEGEATLNA
jgi:hypothetical protein